MTFHHAVMFRWNESVDEAHVARVSAWLDELPGVVPEIRRYAHGSDAGVNTGNYDYAVVAEFDDVDGYLAYRDHPYHQEMFRTVLTGYIAERSAVQFADG